MYFQRKLAFHTKIKANFFHFQDELKSKDSSSLSMRTPEFPNEVSYMVLIDIFLGGGKTERERRRGRERKKEKC